MEVWWNIADRQTVSDQDAFDLAYRSYHKQGKDVVSKIVVLPMSKLNTHPPAMLNQEVGPICFVEANELKIYDLSLAVPSDFAFNGRIGSSKTRSIP